MRLAIVLCISLLLASSLAVTLKTRVNSQQTKQIESLRNNKHSWSKIVLNLAELHMMGDGSLDELIQVLHDLLGDLANKANQYHENYNKDTTTHNESLARFNAEISSANSDIASTTSLLNDVLNPKKHDLQTTIASQEQDIADSTAYIEKITREREESHNNWAQKVDDHTQAISAIDEAETILNQLLFGDQVSMLQIKASKSALMKVEKKLGKRIDATLAKALVELATKEFANQETVRKVIEMLEQIKGNISASLETENANEEREQKDYDANLALTNEHINNVSNSLAANKIDLANTNNSIGENEAFLTLRKDDLANATADLEAEQLHFQQLTDNYNDIITQLNAEIGSGEQALNIIENGQFASYISDRLNNAEGSDAAHFQAY